MTYVQDYRNVYDMAMAKGDVELAELLTRELAPEQAATELKEKRNEHYGVRRRLQSWYRFCNPAYHTGARR